MFVESIVNLSPDFIQERNAINNKILKKKVA